MWHHQPSFLLDYRLNMLALNALSNAQLFNTSTYSKAANILVFIILIKTLLERIFQDAIYHIFYSACLRHTLRPLVQGKGSCWVRKNQTLLKPKYQQNYIIKRSELQSKHCNLLFNTRRPEPLGR